MLRKLALVFFVLLLALFFSCQNIGDGENPAYAGQTNPKPTPNYANAKVENPVYRQIVAGENIKIDESGVTDNSDLYMFVYNVSGKTLDSNTPRSLYAGDDVAFNGVVSEPVRNGGSEKQYWCGMDSAILKRAYYKPLNTATRSTFALRAVRAENNYDRTGKVKASSVGESKYFYKLFTNKTTGQEEITRVENNICAAVNDVCQVFVEGDKYNANRTDVSYYWSGNKIMVTKKGAEWIAKMFEKICAPGETLLGSRNLSRFYYNNIIANPEKITIYIADLGSADGIFTAGYFNPSDLRCDITLSADDFSNQRLLITLNTLMYSQPDGEHGLASTMAHEFNHLLNYVNKVLLNGTAFDTWFTEMLAAITEDFTPRFFATPNSVHNERLPWFNRATNQGLLNWGNGQSVLYSYGFVHAFGAYLVRNYGGAALVNAMATSRFYGMEAVTRALSDCGYKDETFESVLLKFGQVLANADGKDASAPTLNKRVYGQVGNYIYDFRAVDLYDFSAVSVFGAPTNQFTNPNWAVSNTCKNGPWFYRYGYTPTYVNEGAFYSVYLGKVKEFGEGGTSFRFTTKLPEGVYAYLYLKK